MLVLTPFHIDQTCPDPDPSLPLDAIGIQPKLNLIANYSHNHVLFPSLFKIIIRSTTVFLFLYGISSDFGRPCLYDLPLSLSLSLSLSLFLSLLSPFLLINEFNDCSYTFHIDETYQSSH